MRYPNVSLLAYKMLRFVVQVVDAGVNIEADDLSWLHSGSFSSHYHLHLLTMFWKQ